MKNLKLGDLVRFAGSGFGGSEYKFWKHGEDGTEFVRRTDEGQIVRIRVKDYLVIRSGSIIPVDFSIRTYQIPQKENQEMAA